MLPFVRYVLENFRQKVQWIEQLKVSWDSSHEYFITKEWKGETGGM
jgi:hypothetical protein